jgi:hypothetical protein
MADRNALARATDQSSSPTPGYLYNDIAKQTASSPSIASETLTYLIRRLAKNNPQVKYKALKTIAMVSTNPNSRGIFKRTVMQDHNAMRDIKDCLNYRGKSDAVHGDQLSERVRTQAKETLDYVYSEDHPSQSQSSSGGGGVGSASFSSGSGYGAPSSGGYGGGGMGGGGGGGSGGGYGSSNGGYGAGNTAHNNGGGMPVPPGPKRMEGIGNPMFKDPRLEAGAGSSKTISEMTVTDVMQTAKEGFSVAKTGFVGILKDPLARKAAANGPGGMNGPRVGGMGGGYGGNGIGGGGGYGGGGYGAPAASQSSWNAPPGQAQLASSTNGQWTMASNRGPNAISSQDTYRGGGNNVSSGIGGSWGGSGGGGGVAAQARTPQFNTNNHTPMVNISGHPGAANTSGTFEKNLIMELCPPGGMKPEPPADKLQSFCQSLPDLNSDLVCPALLDMLEDGQPWIIRAKVLCVMERCVQVGDEMVRNNAGVNSNAYSDFFHMCSEEIKPLANHSRSAVRMPARRVLKVLGLEAPSDNFAAAPQAAGAGAGAVAPKMPVAVAPAPNLLDFDEAPAVPAGPPPPIPSAAPPTPVAVPPPVPNMAPPAPPAASAGGSMFGGMTMKSTPAPVPVQVPAPVPTPAVEHDLFGVVDVKPTPTSTPAPAAPSMFGDMTVKSTTADVLSVATDAGKENIDNGAQPSAEAPAAGSGFSFLNAGGAAPAAEAAAPKQSFDPLLNAPAPQQQQQQSPAMANMSPQMAAVMQQQQQQILMMQAQMQQMQMGVPGAVGQRMVPGVGVAGMNVNMNMGGMGGIPNQQPPRMGVMGGMGGSGVSTSFAFMEDPSKVKKEETNKKFDFVMDAMKGAK